MEAPRYDVFLSHRSGDKPAVEELARRLLRRGIEPWLDKWHLIPGTPWQEALEKALADCASVAVCLGPGGTGPWQDEEMRAAINRRVQERKSGFRVIPVLLPGARQDEIGPLPSFLTVTTWVEFRDTLDDEEAFRRLVCGILGIAPGPGPEGVVQGVTPYRGLQYFDVDDSLFFAGRRKLTEELLGKLRSGDRLLAVLGASGSGKSSLVRAGLLASLKQGRIAGSETWPQAILKPGEKPLERLVDALVKALPLADDPIELIKKLPEDPRRLHYTVERALREAPAERRLVLFVDQFEEVFTLCTDEAQRKALVENLLHASQAEEGRTLVLLTLRTDFFGHCSPDLAEALSNHHVLVGPMTEDDLRSAIERPAALVGCELEPGLTDLLLEEIEDQAGSLPLLEHALLEIWNRRQGRRLTVQAYRDVDGVQGALEQHADKIYEDFVAAEQEVCRRVFLRLVQVSEGTAATRRRLALSELGQKNQEVVRRLIDARLLTTDGEENPTVEVAHEALITGWKLFQDWIDNDREALLVRRRLDEAVSEWDAKGRDASYLLVGGRLVQAEEWAARRPEEVNESQRELLNASVAQRDEQRRRELAHARRLRLLSYGLAAGLLLATIAAGFAVAEWMKSEQQRRILLARNLAQQVRSVFLSNPSLGLLLAAESVKFLDRLGETGQIEEEEALRWALSQSYGRALESGRVSAVGTTPDLRFLVTAGMDGRARLWDLDAKDPARSGRPLVSLDEGTVSALTLTSDRKWLLTRVTESAKTRVFLRDLTSKDGPRELPEEDWLDARQPFSPDSRWLVTHRTGRALLRDLRTRAIHPLGDRDLRGAAYSPDGRWLATAFTRGPAELRDLRSADPRTRVYELPGIGERTVSLEFAPNGRRIMAVDEDRTQVTWDLDPIGRPGRPVKTDFKGNIELLRFPREAREILGLVGPRRFGSYSPNGRWIIAQGGNEPPKLRDNPKALVAVEPVRSGYSWNQLLAISGNGQFLLTSRGDQVFLLDLKDRGREIEVPGKGPLSRWALGFDGSWIAGAAVSNLFVWQHVPEGFRMVLEAERPDSFRRLTLSPDSRWLASGGRSNIPLLWSLREPQTEPIELTRHLDGLTALAFDPNGRWFATGGREGIVRRYDLGVSPLSVQSVREPEAVDAGTGISTLAFSPDGAWVAVADEAGRIALWKVGAEERPLGNRADAIRSMAFSPDGRSLAGVSESGAAQLWRVGEGLNRVEPVLLTEPNSVQALAFSSDGRLITAGATGEVRRWETKLDELLKIACRTVGRNLTPSEWETYLPGEFYDPREPCPNLPPES